MNVKLKKAVRGRAIGDVMSVKDTTAERMMAYGQCVPCEAAAQTREALPAAKEHKPRKARRSEETKTVYVPAPTEEATEEAEAEAEDAPTNEKSEDM